MKKSRFLVTQDFKSPYMIHTHNPHNPHKIKYHSFHKGEVIRGVMHIRNGKPAIVMVDGILPVPLYVIKEMVEKDIIVSNAEGSKETPKGIVANIKSSNNKMKYADAAIVGAILGFGANYFAEKKGWLPADTKNKYIAMGIGAALTAYLTYRFTGLPKVKQTTETVL